MYKTDIPSIILGIWNDYAIMRGGLFSVNKVGKYVDGIMSRNSINRSSDWSNLTHTNQQGSLVFSNGSVPSSCYKLYSFPFQRNISGTQTKQISIHKIAFACHTKIKKTAEKEIVQVGFKVTAHSGRFLLCCPAAAFFAVNLGQTKHWVYRRSCVYGGLFYFFQLSLFQIQNKRANVLAIRVSMLYLLLCIYAWP